jgi:O-antigen/teichoic acid export membrane protein
MGVIIRQGIKHSLVNYVGAGIGIISMLFIYPLDAEAYGLARFLTDSVILFIPLTLLGANVLPVRFFPHFEDAGTGHRGFLGWLLLLSSIGILLMSILAWISWDSIIDYYGKVSDLYRVYLIFFVPILFLRAFIQLLVQYTSNFHRIVIPSVLNDLLFKITLPTFIVLKVYGVWGYRELVTGILLHFVAVLVGMIAYLWHLGQWSLRIDWAAFRGPVRNEMREYVFYGLMGTISTSIAVNLDVFMIGSMIGPESTGIYGIASIMANLVNRPYVALSLIAAPILMKAWTRKDLTSIRDIYTKSAINGLIPGLLIFMVIWLNLPDLYAIMPNSELIASNRIALLLLGLAFVVNLASGVNTEVMIYSNLFKTHLYAVMILAGVNILLNYLLIQGMGITGAALATLISYVAYNLYKSLVIYLRMGMHPFNRAMGLAMALCGLLVMLIPYVPLTSMRWVDLGLRSLLISTFYIGAVYVLGLSPDINALLRKVWAKTGIGNKK